MRVPATLYILFIVYHSNGNKIFITRVLEHLEKLNFWIADFLKQTNINVSYFSSDYRKYRYNLYELSPRKMGYNKKNDDFSRKNKLESFECMCINYILEKGTRWYIFSNFYRRAVSKLDLFPYLTLNIFIKLFELWHVKPL